MPIHPEILKSNPKLFSQSVEEARLEAEQLTQEFFEATASMGLANREISIILGVSEPTISRAKRKSEYFSRTRHHQWLIAELLIKACRELTRIYNHPRKEKHWFTTYNPTLAAFPIDLILRYEGLCEVVRYLEGREVYKKGI
jgi:hypothetical protein